MPWLTFENWFYSILSTLYIWYLNLTSWFGCYCQLFVYDLTWGFYLPTGAIFFLALLCLSGLPTIPPCKLLFGNKNTNIKISISETSSCRLYYLFYEEARLPQEMFHFSEALVSKNVVKIMMSVLYVLWPCRVQKLCCWFERERVVERLFGLTLISS